MIRAILATGLFLMGAPQMAVAEDLTSGLSGLSFLVGSWRDAKGVVADTGGTSTGRSDFTVEANGGLLLRRDHTNLFDTAGKPSGGFDQIMMIYPEGGAVHGDYFDGQHTIRYNHVDIAPDTATFTSIRLPGQPVYKLVYHLTDPKTLSVAFSILPPGASDFQPIATGTMARAN